MKRGSTLFLKFALICIALIATTWLIRFPPMEGAAAGKDLISIYTNPFILYGYVASIPFFVGLYQSFKLLNLIDKNKAFSQGAVNTLRNIKFASLSLIGFIVLGVMYIHFTASTGDDPAGPTMLGFLVSLAVAVIATAAGVFQKLFQNAVDLKSENDLTV